MTAATNYLENELLDHAMANGAWTAPTSIHMKLHTGSPGEAATANAAANTTRAAVSFGNAVNGTVTSDADISWTNVSNTETYTHWSLWDNATAGNPLVYGAFDAAIAVTAGDNFVVESGNLTVTLA